MRRGLQASEVWATSDDDLIKAIVFPREVLRQERACPSCLAYSQWRQRRIADVRVLEAFEAVSPLSIADECSKMLGPPASAGLFDIF